MGSRAQAAHAAATGRSAYNRGRDRPSGSSSVMSFTGPRWNRVTRLTGQGASRVPSSRPSLRPCPSQRRADLDGTVTARDLHLHGGCKRVPPSAGMNEEVCRAQASSPALGPPGPCWPAVGAAGTGPESTGPARCRPQATQGSPHLSTIVSHGGSVAERLGPRHPPTPMEPSAPTRHWASAAHACPLLPPTRATTVRSVKRALLVETRRRAFTTHCGLGSRSGSQDELWPAHGHPEPC